MTGPVSLSFASGVATLTLAAPATGNALDLAMAVALAQTVAEVRHLEGLRVVRIDAVGPAFCVGGSLAEFAGVADASAHIAQVVAAAHDALRGLAALSVPLVCVVQGAAAGGGLGLAFSGDVVLAARSAKFVVAYAGVGLSPDCGVSWVLARQLGEARALDLALTNRSFSAEEAATWGLVSRVVDDAQLEDQAGALVEKLADGSVAALAATKRLIRCAGPAGWQEHLEREAQGIIELAASRDAHEGMRAFLEKRRPEFR